MRGRAGSIGRVALLFLLGSVLWCGGVRAADSMVSELLLSLLRPVEAKDAASAPESELDGLLAGRPTGGQSRPETLGKPRTDQVLSDPQRATPRGGHPYRRQSVVGRPFPGNASLRTLQERRLTGLSPSSAGRMLDPCDDLCVAGSLPADPSCIYSAFEIRVQVSQYALELIGIREAGEPTVLYSTKVGLGSPDFPTPRGSWYIVRIFDDKPLWIPPPNRDWAWGQPPSRSAYGGHMMPFYNKVPLKSDDKAPAPAEEVDMVAPFMEMKDTGTYRIHGTDSPWSVGSGQSHGCVRMRNATVKKLADHLKMYVGMRDRGVTENGPYVNLARPVKLILY